MKNKLMYSEVLEMYIDPTDINKVYISEDTVGRTTITNAAAASCDGQTYFCKTHKSRNRQEAIDAAKDDMHTLAQEINSFVEELSQQFLTS